jgi:hypothetical protein
MGMPARRIEVGGGDSDHGAPPGLRRKKAELGRIEPTPRTRRLGEIFANYVCCPGMAAVI